MILLGLLDSIRDQMADGNTEGKEVATNNIKKTLEIASDRLLHKVSNNELDLDVKDIKDIASVYQLLTQNTQGDVETGAPQAPAGINQMYKDSNVLNVHDSPDGKKVEINQSDVLNLSSDDVDKLVTDQFKKQNDLNYQASEG